MARLASQAKKGFFPFPPELVGHVTKWLDVPMPDKTVILDPCAGEGAAVASVADMLAVPKENLLCAELDEARADACRARGLRTVVGDALSEIHIPQTGCSLLWLNPPYDASQDGFRRLETHFLGRFGRTLVRGGVLAFVVPLKILQRNEYKAFPHNHKNIRILRFPDEDNKFGQCVVLATRMYGKTESEEKNWQEQLENPMSLHDRPTHLYKVPAVTLPEDLHKKFYSDFLTQEDLGKLAADRMVRAAHEIDVRLSDNRLKPLMPLRIGHQALVLATGAFDGVYKAPDTGNTLVLFGNTERAETSVETDEGDGTGKRVVRSAPRSQVIAWDMTESAELGEPVLYKYV